MQPGGLGNSAAPPRAGSPFSPRSKLRQRRKKNKGRVHWDEQAIAEHDKERSDTTWGKSRQTVSDCETYMASSDDDHRIIFGPPARTLFGTGDNSIMGKSLSMGDVNPAAVAHRLDAWVRSGAQHKGGRARFVTATSSDGDVADHSNLSSACSSRCSSIAPQRRPSNEGKPDRHISIEVEEVPKATSDSFKAKRIQHYNEMAAIKAFKQQDVTLQEQDDDSDTSDEDKRIELITINTNTNINTTIAQADVCSKLRKYSVDSSAAGSDRDIRRKPSSEQETTRSQRSSVSFSGGESGMDSSDGEGGTGERGTSKETCVSSGIDSSDGERLKRHSIGSGGGSNRSQRSSVSFSGGESGNESSEDFRNSRRNHSLAEWKRGAPEPCSLETNTNTNLNAGASLSSGVVPGTAGCGKNPMEAGRAPVRFVAAEVDGQEGNANDDAGASSSEEFRALRQQHYDEVAAVIRFRSESGGEEDEADSSSSASDVIPMEQPQDDTQASAGEERPSSSSQGAHTLILAANPMDPDDIGHIGNPANPMEPRDAGLAFSIDGQLLPAPTEETGAQDMLSPEQVDWRQRRNVHYSEMAAALRSAAPPSSEEEEDAQEAV